MYKLRLFGISLVFPLLLAGICSEPGKGNFGRHFSLASSIAASNSSVNLGPVNFPTNSNVNTTSGDEFKISPRSITSPFSRRGGLYAELDHHLISKLIWKAISSYAVVFFVNLLVGPILKKFGLHGGPHWETSIQLGSSSKDEHEDEKGSGWGWDKGHSGAHGHNQPGHYGFNPNHVGPGWLSYDQYAIGLPLADKYSMKAAKKAQKYTKKAAKYAQKASKYAAKAQAAKLSIKPLYANGFIHPGAATVPGVPAYGWGR